MNRGVDGAFAQLGVDTEADGDSLGNGGVHSSKVPDGEWNMIMFLDCPRASDIVTCRRCDFMIASSLLAESVNWLNLDRRGAL